MVGVYHILSQLEGLGSIVSSPSGVWGGGSPSRKRFGRFVRNSVRFYVCFSALWKLAVIGIITLKVQENITAVGKVTLHVWSSNWGQRPWKL